MPKYSIKNHRLCLDGVAVPYRPLPNKKLKTRETIKPTFFTYHFTASGDNLDNVVNFLREKTVNDAHLVIDRAGNIIQLAPLNRRCNHMGQSSYRLNGKDYNGLNRHAAGIEVTNPGGLDIVTPGKRYRSWSGQEFTDADGIIETRHHLRGAPVQGWLPFTEAQLFSVFEIAAAMKETYGSYLIGHDETTTRKSDPGPLSQINVIREQLYGHLESDDKAPDASHITLAEINHRRWPSFHDNILQTIPRDTPVQVIRSGTFNNDGSENLWHLVAYKRQEGWIFGELLSPID